MKKQKRQSAISRLATVVALLMTTIIESNAAIKAGDATVEINSTTTISLASTYQTTLRNSSISTYRWSTTSPNLNITSQSAYSCTIKGLSAGTAQVDYFCGYYINGYYRTMDFYYTVTVKSGVVNLTISPTSITLNEGDTYSVTAYQPGYIGGVYFTSDNSSIASVKTDNNSGYYTYGTVTANSEGTTYIYAKSANGATSTECTVTVKASKKYQSLALSSLPNMTYGDTYRQLPSTTDQGLSLTWTSNKSAVATISSGKLYIKGAGQATITASNSGNSSYFAFSRSYTLNVTKSSLTITANDCTKSQGEENPELTVTYSGFRNSDDASVLATQPKVTTTATIDSPVGTYPITVSGASAANYDITYVSGTLTVTAKEPDVIEVTDISQMDNAIYIEPSTTCIGGSAQIEICLKNAETATAYVFDLVLPEGVKVAKDDKGKFIDELSDRHNDHTRTFNEKGNNTYSLSTLSGSSEELTGNDGVIRLLTLNVASDVAEGVYVIEIKNASYSKPDGVLVNLENTISTITIEDYVLGDVNSNGGVDIGDAVTIVNYLVGKNTSSFVEKAADTNKNGQTDIGDAVTIVNYLVGKTPIMLRNAKIIENGSEPQ